MLISNILINVVVLILLTLVGGLLPLIERKYLSLIQRRVGPTFVGYKGRLQFIADALKMFLKGCIVPNQLNNFFFFLFPVFTLFLCYLNWLNIFWNLNLIYLELEYNVVYATIVSFFINAFIALTGIYAKNKYAMLGAVRTLMMLFCLELLLGIFFLCIYVQLNSFNYTLSIVIQSEYPYFTIFFLICSLVIILILLDLNRIPYDFAEAENELIAGFHVEYGAFLFGLFYLSEYFHLFFFSLIINILLIGL